MIGQHSQQTLVLENCSNFIVKRCRGIQLIRCPAAALAQAAAQTEGQRYRILLEVQPCIHYEYIILSVKILIHSRWIAKSRVVFHNAESKRLHI